MKKIGASPGDIIRIPLPDGTHTYARILVDNTYAFYDARRNDDNVELAAIIKHPILFMTWVDVFGLKERWWSIVGNIPLEGRLENFYPSYFGASPADPVNLHYCQAHKDEIELAIKDDWIGDRKIQLDGLHGRLHIESRLIDYYEGRRSKFNHQVISLFKQLAGLPLDNM